MKKFYLVFSIAIIFMAVQVSAQVFDANDPIIEYDEDNPPANPPGGTVAKWVRTSGVNWNTNQWKAYIINGMAFRLRFPNNYDPNRAEAYPMVVILHGLGFSNGNRFMNERHLNNSGAKAYEDAINQGKFDGFVLSPQANTGWFNTNYLNSINTVISQASSQLNLNRDRISINGRSGGAQSLWSFMQEASQNYAAALPMAGVNARSTDNIDAYKYMPVWIFQGELDSGPSPATTEGIINQIVAKKGNVTYTKYKNSGHGIFDKGYAEPDYWPFLMRVHKANPAVLKGEYVNVFENNGKWIYEFVEQNEPCPGDAINIKLGLTAGFSAYEWKKDGQIISGATSNEYTVTEVGTYEARFRRGNVWSDWSPEPIVVEIKEETVTPDIVLQDNASRVIPAPDGSESVFLELPQGYAEYEWRRVSDNVLVGSSRVFEATIPGDYRAKVTENFGCTSSFSETFKVINAEGTDSPEAALGFNGFASSKTDIKLLWSSNPNDPNPATGFELYRSQNEEGPFQFITITDANAIEYVDSDLVPNTDYFYKIRSVNNNGASEVVNSASIKTLVDNKNPTAPTNLELTEITPYSAALNWNEASDDVGVYRYDVYRDGIKVLSVESTDAVIYNLQSNRLYKFQVKARDLTGNESPFSNRVIGLTSLNNTSLANLKFNDNLIDASAGNTQSSISGNVGFSLAEKKEGTASIQFSGAGYVDFDQNDAFIHSELSSRSIAFWFKQTNNNGVQDLFDEGGSVNGLALRVNNGTLEFAVRNQNTQRTISTPISINTWHHVAAVYNQNNIQLFLDGVSVAVNNNVPYSTIGAHSDGGGIGATNGSNAFGQTSNGFQGYIDDLYIFGTALSEAQINALIDLEGVVTLPDEEIASPANVTATATSYNEIELTWDDMSENEIQFQIYRASEGEDFAPIAIVEQDSESFTDEGLEAETTYRYSVVALSEYNASEEVVSTISSLNHLLFEDNLQDNSGNNVTTQSSGSITYSSDAQQGEKSIYFNGNSLLNLDNGNQFIHDQFTERSIAFWFKSEDAGGTQDIYDEGGSTNGIGIRLVGSDIQLTVQNQHAIFSVQSAIDRSQWNHIMGVFASGELRLYVNGLLAAERTDISYQAVDNHGDAGGLGGTNGSNAFDVNSDNFKGFIDDFYVFGTAMDTQVQQVMESASPAYQATTLPLPVAPAAIEDLEITANDFESITLSFTDNADNEEYFTILRAINQPVNFQEIETVEAQSGQVVSYKDEDILSNIVYYYKVTATNAGGTSESDIVSGSTLNRVPVLSDLPENITMRFGTTYELSVYATDEDGDELVITAEGLPAFAQLTDYGDGSGMVLFSPEEEDLNEEGYNGIVIKVEDGNGGFITDTLSLVVNSNHLPEINEISLITLEEGEEATINITATDVEGSENLSWEWTLPAFADLIVNTDGSASLVLSPGYADHGIYEGSITVTDLDGASDATSFQISVNDKNPNRFVQVNFTDGSLLGGSEWNNTSGHPVIGDLYQGLIDTDGETSPFSVEVNSNWTNNGSNTLGSTTGNNSGIFPDNVMQSAYWTGGATESITVKGLDNSKTYKFTFFGSRQANNDRSTRYTVDGQSAVLNAASNVSQTATINGLSPESGELIIEIARAGGSTYGYINALVIEEKYDDGLAPALPSNITAQFKQEENEIMLNWNDQAFNETGYRVYKSSTIDGVYELSADLSVNATSFADNDISANTTYFYKVSVYNNVGESISDIISAEVPNVAPIIAELSNVDLSIGDSTTIEIQASDDSGDIINLTAIDLPAFASFTDNGEGLGSLSLAPKVGDEGQFEITLRAEDQNGAYSESSITLNVQEASAHNYYINFAGSAAFSQQSPWNNYVGGGNAGSNLNNINAAESGFSSISLSILDSWNGYNTSGMTGSSEFPNNVTQSALWVNGTQDKRIRLSGFPTDMAYDISFFASRSGGGDRTTIYTINGESVSLNAANNVNEVVTLSGVLPNSNGQILITANKAGSASFGYLNALIIKGYEATSIPATPTNLEASAIDGSSIAINFQDNSNLETAYEVWRSENGASYNLISNLDPNVTNYLNEGLSKGITYYYKVRAQLSDESFTEFSNVAGTSTINSVISINFNVDNPASAPWNNTNSLPEAGTVFSNLMDENSNNSGVSFEIVESNPSIDPSLYGFSGDNPFGMNTGNDSGAVPDNVMRSTYWMDQGLTSELRFFNLDLSQKYNFTFFASREGNGNRTSVYTINGKSASLNAANNVNNTTDIRNISPDENGDIVVSITSAEGALFSYIGGLIISSANDIGNSNQRQLGSEEILSVTDEFQEAKFAAYPNPFSDAEQVRIAYNGEVSERISVIIYSPQGATVFSETLQYDPVQGYLVLDELRDLDKGLYLVKLYSDQIDGKVLRLIKH